MSTTQWIAFWVMLLTFSQWVIYLKVREWQRSRHPEPKQGKPVDRVLWHTLSDTGTPWAAGDSWQRKGRRMTVALIRQGLGEMLHELSVNDYAPIYQLGYTVREEEQSKAVEALTAKIERRDKIIEQLRDELREAQRHRPEPIAAPAAPRPKPKQSEWEAACEEWGRTSEGMSAIMQRMTTTEDTTQTEEPTPDYKSMKGKEKIETMLKLKAEGKTNPEIAELFGMTTGGVKGIISKNKPRPDNIIPLNFGVSEEVSEGF